jgi:hypothetical protein
MTDNENGMYERPLGPDEIEERKTLNLALQGERDDNLAEVDEKRRQIRALNVARKKLELQSAEVRREIRLGRVLESRQGLLALDVPAPVPSTARHGEGPLLDAVELRHLITCVRPRELWPTVAAVESWHEQVRADVQKWCQVELARAAPIAGLPSPAALQMPNVLENIAFTKYPNRQPPAARAATKKMLADQAKISDGKRKAGKRKASKRARA